jgi:hypothetical protein
MKARFAVVALGLLCGLSLQGCGLGAEDVPFNVRVINDTSHTVVDQTDEDASDSTTLKAGQSFLDSEFTNEGVRPDRITSLSGATLGCLPFQFTNTPPATLVVKISQMVPCRHWAVGSNIRRDWPDPKY